VADDQIKGSRMRRAASMAGVAASVAARSATAKAVSGRSETAAANQQLKSAEALVKVLGGMRGAAMKVGQTLSAVDVGMVPEEVRPRFQEILASLQQDAEPVSFKALSKVITGDLGGRLSDHFADFDEEPLAAASIGQVHRATTRDGQDVAVKVQYPGITEAIQADLKNLRLALRLLDMIAPGINTGAIADEIRERISEELDYELEATNQRAMARAYRDHPFIIVPGVVTELCRERVIVSEFIEGERFADAKLRSQPERDRFGEILVRFYISGPMRHRLLNGDPHPGNALFLADGRVAFLDFGFFKRLSDAEIASLIGSTRAVHDGDAEKLMEVMVAMGALEPNPALAQPFLEAYDAILGWTFVEEELRVDGTRTGEMMRRYNQLQGHDDFASLTLPAEHLVMMRSAMLLTGLLGMLEASNNWSEITREWLYDEPAVTELGLLEADFLTVGGPAISGPTGSTRPNSGAP
jgi:predicted unusual protein kinase regulating ubiquinone biosynthesis (AarF/ABC1/UbiB family)